MNCIGKTDTVKVCVDSLSRPLITKARIPRPDSVKHSRCGSQFRFTRCKPYKNGIRTERRSINNSVLKTDAQLLLEIL